MTLTTAYPRLPDHYKNLSARISGTVVAAGDHDYDPARSAWNLNAEHRPALVAYPENATDISEAVQFARRAGMGVGVMATGHGTGQPNNGGLLINTSRMREVTVEADTRVARVGAGALWRDVVAAAAPYGLAGLAGSSTGVGVVGYTLGGGFGWLGRRYGFAAHSILRADVVTADGDLITASPDEHPDLFWALQGGTGNLGIVTSMEFRLYPVSTVYAGNLYYPLDRARELLEFYAHWSRSAPLELTSAATFRSFPPVPTVPEPLRGRTLVALRGCYCGDPADGRALIDSARAALGPAAADTFAEMAAGDLATVSMDPVDPLPASNHVELLRDLTPGAIDALVSLAGPASYSPLVMLEARQLGGALTGEPDQLHPMAHTSAAFSLNAIGVTATPSAAAGVRAHLAKLEELLRPHVTGDTYLNFLDLDGATPTRIRAAFSDADWDRLVRLKAAYDPQNVFRFNRNIAIDSSHTSGK